jgi:hypothetical protein
MLLGHLTAAAVVASSLIALTVAHRGVLTKPSCGSDFGSSATSLNIPDPTISTSMKHWADCSKRGVWIHFRNRAAGDTFYVGVGVPTKERFVSLRANALIIGPSLPTLSQADFASLPPEIRSDPLLNSMGNISAVLHSAPADQSTCAHLGPTMARNSKVVNGRCDFLESYGQTHSWRVLDVDSTTIPTANAVYHVVVYLQSHTSGKFGIALGTWQEDFRTTMTVTEPACTVDLGDFSEKVAYEYALDFPVSSCTNGTLTTRQKHAAASCIHSPHAVALAVLASVVVVALTMS